jgi:hypothetical protein
VAVRGELIRPACCFVHPEALVRADRFIEQSKASMIAMWIKCWVTFRQLVKQSGVPELAWDSARSRWLDVSVWGA